MKNFWSRQFLVLAMVASSFSLALPAVAADERWAPLVGVDKCANLGELKVCAADARSLQAVLEQAGYQGQVKVLADDGPDLSQWPTQSNLERAIENLAKTADAGDTILLFFSGHGLTRNGEGYLVPSDGDQKRGLALAWVKDQLRASKAREKILILDACHAGTAKGVTGIVPDATASKDLVMLLSCDRDQVSWPDEAGGHSVFTAALIAGLAGQAVVGPDRRVTAAALHRYVQGRVKQWVFTNGRESQTPLLVADATGDVVLAELAMANPAAVTRNVTPLTTATATSNVTPPPTNGKPGDLWTNRIGMKLAYLPAGEFVMGSAANEEHPVGAETPHPVKISNPFLIGVTEVTQEQWKAIMGNCPSKFKGRDDLPVENVSWHEAVEFCKKLSANSGLAYRLPTEAEWEYACRAGTTGPYAGTCYEKCKFNAIFIK